MAVADISVYVTKYIDIVYTIDENNKDIVANNIMQTLNLAMMWQKRANMLD